MTSRQKHTVVPVIRSPSRLSGQSAITNLDVLKSELVFDWQVEEELETYDDHVNSSFKHTWWEDEGRRRNVYFEAPSSAIDANTTFSVRNNNLLCI